MTVKIHIPSSESPPDPRRGDVGRRAPGPVGLAVAGLLAVGMIVVLVVSVVSGVDTPDTSVPAPFEATEVVVAETPEPEPVAWSMRAFPGDGWVLAMGTVGDTPIAVTTDSVDVHIWERDERVWTLAASPDLGRLESFDSVSIADDRILLVGHLEGRPTVWEWVGGSLRYLFQPTSGVVAGMWSVGGQLLVAVTPDDPDIETAVRYGRPDALWVESDGAFEQVELVDIESVLAAGGDPGRIAVGGRDAEGRAVIGFLQDGRVLADRLPDAPETSAVTDLAGESSSIVAVVSVANRPGGVAQEIRVGKLDLATVATTSELVGIELVGDVVFGALDDGTVMTVAVDGVEHPPPATPSWENGSVIGIALLGDEPVIYGRTEWDPAFMSPGSELAEFVLPSGSWERYHSEASDGFRLVHVGSLEFATRDAELFYRSWNADRWHRAESDGGLIVYGAPRIAELSWGYALIPAAGTGMWTSEDGHRWTKVEGSDTVRVHDVVTDGEIVVGVTPLGAIGGPSSSVTVLGANRELVTMTLPYRLDGPVWEENVGFAATITPPQSGYATSQDGLTWQQHDGPYGFERVTAFGGALYYSSGEPVTEGGPPAETPEGQGWLFSFGGLPAWQSFDGATWLHTGDEWLEVGLGVADGLPGRPQAVVVRDANVFAMIETSDGVAETYVLGLD